MTKRKSRGLMSQVLGRMTARECLIDDRSAESMLVGLLAEADRVEDPMAAWNEVRTEVASAWGFDDGPEGPKKPFIYQDGVAVIPVHGILINRFNYCWGFVTGYDFIRKQMNAALVDDDVKLIVYDHDTPGGEAAGCDELAREIFASRSIKPTMALVNTSSCSGGYWLAAPCSRIVCAPSGSVGSIGVYIQHMNIQRMLAEWGIENEYVKNGKFKTSGNPYESLSEEDRAYLQAMVDERADEFFAAVAEFRGVEESIVRGTEARVMRPPEALSLGLIDAAESPTTAVASFVTELGNEEPTTTEDSQEEVTMAEISSEDRAAVANETKARIKGIMTHDEAKGREGLAEHLAYNTDMSVEDAAVLLAAAPKAEDEKPKEQEPAKEEPKEEPKDEPKEDAKSKSAFESAMDTSKHPEVGADGKDSANAPEGDSVTANIDRILGAQSAMTGRKFESARA